MSLYKPYSFPQGLNNSFLANDHMNKKTAIALAAITLSLGSQLPAYKTQTTNQTPTPSPATVSPTPPFRAQPTQRLELITMIERDLDTIWTTENRQDGKYLIDLQLRFKNTHYGLPNTPNPFHRNNQELGQILQLKRRGTQRAYLIVGSNGNYFGSVDELLYGTVTFDLYDGHVEPLRRIIKTFEFVPNERSRK